MIEISRKAVRQMITHAERESPKESCGLLLLDGTVLPMRNVAESHKEFRFDPVEQLKVFEDLDDIDDVVAVYHSHPLHIGAKPSGVDLTFHWPEEAHMIITCGTEIAAYLNGEKVGIHYVD